MEREPMEYRPLITSHQDFPKEGVLFWDFTGLLADPTAFASAIEDIRAHFAEKGVSTIAAIEAKGFTIAAALAYAWKKPLVLIRKPGLIPGSVYSKAFVKEYGTGTYEMKKGALSRTDRVLIVYDILAAAGATEAAIALVEKQGASVVGCAYAIELSYLGGRDAFPGRDLFSLTTIEDREEGI